MWKFMSIFVIAVCIYSAKPNSVNQNRLFESNAKLLIPTLKSQNEKCREHSELYLKEFRDYKLWATEMFDATGKFPSGILYGSAYELGNFDQCVNIKVPYKNDQFNGKYCMAKFTFNPPKYILHVNKMNYFDDYRKYYNYSVWDKVLATYGDDSKASRNEFYFSFCLPSSCTHKDLQDALKEVIEESGIEMTANVEEKHCQVMKKYHFDVPDFLFTVILLLFVLIVIMCSFFDMCVIKKYISPDEAPKTNHQLILCFSFPYNLKKLASESTGTDGLEFLAGVKVISMFLIILGHRCMFIFGSPIINPQWLEEIYTKVEATLILNGPIIVDTFFLVSGFLASYFTLLLLEKSSLGSSLIKIYLHRLIRMMPSYIMVLAFYSTVFVNVGSGPFWKERVEVEQQRCIKSWWTNILYINNYVNTENLCMFQSWYLTCDMHYFLLVPFITWLLRKKPSAGLTVLIGIIVVSILTVFIVIYNSYEQGILLLYPKLLRDPVSNPTFRNIYIPTHLRATPYFVGVLTGYIKYKLRNTKRKIFTKWVSRVSWVIGVTIAMATIHLAFIFYLPGIPKLSIISAGYGAIHHFTFSACIGYLIIGVSVGRGAWIEPILSWKPFVLLGRITYTAFLCHGAVQIYTAAIIRAPSYGGVFYTFYQTAGDITWAFTFGFLLSMLFESPIIGLEKILLGAGHRPQTNMNNLNEKTISIYDVKVFQNGDVESGKALKY